MRPTSQPPYFITYAIALLLFRCIGVKACLEGLNCDSVPAHPTQDPNELELRWEAVPRAADPEANPLPIAEANPVAEAMPEPEPGNYGSYNNGCCEGCPAWQCGHSYTPAPVWTPKPSWTPTPTHVWWTPTHSVWTPTSSKCCECGECGAYTVVKTVYGGGGCYHCGDVYETHVTAYVQPTTAVAANVGYCSTLFADGPGLPTTRAGSCGTILVLSEGVSLIGKWGWIEVSIVTGVFVMYLFGGLLLL